MTKRYDWLWNLFCVWYAFGLILVGFDWLPPWLAWANPVFLWLAGAVGAIVLAKGVTRPILVVTVVFFGSIFVETLGVKTGFPFGEYAYAEAFGPTLLGVPVTIGAAWLAVIGSSFAVAQLFSFTYRTILLVPLLAVWLDMAIDPVSANVKSYWIWKEPGIYYDIPTQNFIAWFAVSFLFALLIKRFETTTPPRLLRDGQALFLMLHLLFGVTAFNAGLSGISGLTLLTAIVLVWKWRRQRDYSNEKSLAQ